MLGGFDGSARRPHEFPSLQSRIVALPIFRPFFAHFSPILHHSSPIFSVLAPGSRTVRKNGEKTAENGAETAEKEWLGQVDLPYRQP